jgi:hypothetical protein
MVLAYHDAPGRTTVGVMSHGVIPIVKYCTSFV